MKFPYLAIALLLPISAQAQQVTILSEGTTTCGEYTAQPAMQPDRMEWALGYISGLNAGLARAGIKDVNQDNAGRSFQKPATAIGWLQSYCAAHPLDILVNAAENLRNDFIAHERQ